MRKWIWLLILIIWVGALVYPWRGLPPLLNFLTYPTSPLQISFSDDGHTFAQSPYPGLQVNYDQRGVPHIFAENDPALAFGMGYTHAKDRLFQLEMLRRTTRGRLSEVVGPRALNSDKFWLKFQFEEKSKAAYEAMLKSDPELTNMFDAYANGFNFYLEQMKPAEKALEFHLLGFEPTPMQAHTPIMLIRYMDKVLAYSENDLKFSALRNHLPDSLIHYYYPLLSEYAFPIYPEISPGAEATFRDSAALAYLPQSDFPSAQVRRGNKNEVGSNNWAVAAKKSASGNAFLCNDTHLGLDLPGTWYEVHQVVNNRIVHGFSIPGSPFVVSGFSGKVGWGMTNATWDLTEFYHLETNANGEYKLDGQWEKMEAVRTEIPVKGAKAYPFTFYNTYFGPTDTLDGEMLATQWVADDFGQNEMRAFYELYRADNVQSAYEALLNFGHPPQNFVLADIDGNIGMVTSGLAMHHTKPGRGISWGLKKTDRIPFQHMGRKLHVLNPDKNWNQSSNHHQVIDSTALQLNSMFAPSARGRRISAMLQTEGQIDRAYLKKMHGDVVDGEWPLLKAHILATAPAELKAYFKGWNGEMTESSVAATLYEMYKWRLRDSLSQAIVGDFDFYPPSEHLFYLVHTGAEFPLEKGRIKLGPLAQRVWLATLEALQEELGKDPKAWAYKNYHKIYFEHLAGIEALSHPAFGAQSSPRTVNVSSNRNGSHGPSMRTLIEFTPQGPRAETVLAGGQSGQPGHPNYTDQIDDWYRVEYFPIAWISQPGEKDWKQTVRFE